MCEASHFCQRTCTDGPSWLWVGPNDCGTSSSFQLGFCLVPAGKLIADVLCVGPSGQLTQRSLGFLFSHRPVTLGSVVSSRALGHAVLARLSWYTLWPYLFWRTWKLRSETETLDELQPHLHVHVFKVCFYLSYNVIQNMTAAWNSQASFFLQTKRLLAVV